MNLDNGASFDLQVYGFVTRDILTATAGSVRRLGGAMYAASTAASFGDKVMIVAVASSQQLAEVEMACKERAIHLELRTFEGNSIDFQIFEADEIVDQVTRARIDPISIETWPRNPQEFPSASFCLVYPVSPPAALEFLMKAKGSGSGTAIDLQHDVECTMLAKSLVSHSDFVFCNRHSLLRLGQSDDLIKSIDVLRGESSAVFVVKLGIAGSLVCRPGHEIEHVPAHQSSFKYTVGAGDAFDATFLSAIRRGLNENEAALAASKAAAIVIESAEQNPASGLSWQKLTQDRVPIGINPLDTVREIYVAGHFHSHPLEVRLRYIAEAIERVGFKVFLPKRDAGEVGMCGVTANDAFVADIGALDRATAMVALLDGASRGGTYFEIGYAHKRGIPILILCTDRTLGISNMISQSAKYLGEDMREVLSELVKRAGHY